MGERGKETRGEAAAGRWFPPLGLASFARTAQRGFRSLRLLLASDVCALQQRASGDEAIGKALPWSAVQDSLVRVTSLPSVPQGLPPHCRRKPEATGISQEALLSIVLETPAGGVQAGRRGGVSLRGRHGDAGTREVLSRSRGRVSCTYLRGSESLTKVQEFLEVPKTESSICGSRVHSWERGHELEKVTSFQKLKANT